MDALTEARHRAAETYNAAADAYDDPANSFWSRFGTQTVERLHLRRGSAVLDVCCGSGASAIPAARVVGPEGTVIGIDLAGRLLDIARQKARAEGLTHVRFQEGDMLDLKFASESFDAVVCVFGIFFVPDMTAAVRELWRVVKPGGRLAVTTWGPRFFEPGNTAFWNAVREVAPELHKGFNPWDRISDAKAVKALLRTGGIENPEAIDEPGWHELESAEAWWSAVLGSGYRGTVDKLDDEAQARVRTANLAFIEATQVSAVEANVVYANAEKPRSL